MMRGIAFLSGFFVGCFLALALMTSSMRDNIMLVRSTAVAMGCAQYDEEWNFYWIEPITDWSDD